MSGKYSWSDVVSGFNKPAEYNIRNNKTYRLDNLYPKLADMTPEQKIEFLENNKAIIDYVDTSEEETALIAINNQVMRTSPFYTHRELDPSLIFGVMGNSIIYPETNQFPRNCFSCGQSRQAVSVYHSNAQMRMDKMGVLLNYGQTPLIKSRYLEYINNQQQPYGVNTIVAIMSYTGYNVEDAILINEGSVKRGLFKTTYYTTSEGQGEFKSVWR